METTTVFLEDLATYQRQRRVRGWLLVRVLVKFTDDLASHGVAIACVRRLVKGGLGVGRLGPEIAPRRHRDPPSHDATAGPIDYPNTLAGREGRNGTSGVCHRPGSEDGGRR
jgi:hypothetical protein